MTFNLLRVSPQVSHRSAFLHPQVLPGLCWGCGDSAPTDDLCQSRGAEQPLRRPLTQKLLQGAPRHPSCQNGKGFSQEIGDLESNQVPEERAAGVRRQPWCVCRESTGLWSQAAPSQTSYASHFTSLQLRLFEVGKLMPVS